MASPAANLFVARARAANPGFVVSDRNAGMVADICQRLDGLPLALELTAARVRALGLADLLARLDQVLRYRGGRDLPERQQTMLAAIDWSHALLTAEEQQVFCQLGVFAGSFSLESAEDVIVAGDGGDIAGMLERLVEQSLLMVRPQPDDAVRYRLLTPIRHYAIERLEASGEVAATELRHAMHYLQFAEQARVGMRGRDQLHWFERLDLEHDNVRRAMRWAIANQQVEIAARLGFALEGFWWVRGYQREGYHLMQQVMAMQDRMPMWLQELAMIAMSTTAYGIADYATVERLADDLLDLSERFDGAVCAGAFARVELGLLAIRRGDYPAAERQLQASPDLFDVIGDQGMVSQALSFIGTLRQAEGDLASARQKFEEGLNLARTAGDRLGECNALFNLAQLALAAGDLVTAGARFREGIRPSVDMGDRPNLAFILEGLGVVAGAAGDHARAALLFGAAGGLFEAAGLRGHTYYALDAVLYDRIGSQVRAALGDVTHEATCAIGRAMTIEAVLHEAYAETPSLGRQLAV
jgi:predicted ATPase